MRCCGAVRPADGGHQTGSTAADNGDVDGGRRFAPGYMSAYGCLHARIGKRRADYLLCFLFELQPDGSPAEAFGVNL